MSQRGDEEEEEETTTNGGSTARKAWYAGHAEAEHGISAAFRGVPGVPHGGSQTVTHADIAGSMDWCWCGQPFDHDWPGKADGRKHPRKEQEVTSTSTETEEQPRIERRALRAYHADLADIILSAVNDYGNKYRITAHSVIIFPLDGTKPYAINARNGDRQVKAAKNWFVRHCVPLDKPIKDAAKPAVSNRPVDEDAVKELAEMINSEEHLPKDESAASPPAEPAPPAAKKAMSKTAKKVVPPQPPAEEPKASDFEGVQGVQPSDVAAASDEWVPYRTGKGKGKSKHAEGKEHPFYLTNGVDVKCPEHNWVGPPKSTGGHTRTHHTDTTTLWGPKAKEKGVQTYFTNKAHGQVKEAITILQNAMGIEPPKAADTSALEAEIRDLKAQVKELSSGPATVKDLAKQLEEMTAERDALETKLSDQETKMALAREAFGL